MANLLVCTYKDTHTYAGKCTSTDTIIYVRTHKRTNTHTCAIMHTHILALTHTHIRLLYLSFEQVFVPQNIVL